MPITDDITVRFNVDFGGSVKELGELSGAVSRLSGTFDQLKSTADGFLTSLQGIVSTIQSLSSSHIDIIPSSALQNARELEQIIGRINAAQVNIGGGGAAAGGYGGGGGFGGGGMGPTGPVGGGVDTGAPARAAAGAVSTLLPILAALGTVSSVGGQGLDWYRGYGELWQMGGGAGGTTHGTGWGGLAADKNRPRDFSFRGMAKLGLDYGYGVGDVMEDSATLMRAGGAAAMDKGGLETSLKTARLMGLDSTLVANIVGTVYSVTGLAPTRFAELTRDITAATGRMGQQQQIMQNVASVMTETRMKYGAIGPEAAERAAQVYADMVKGGFGLEEAKARMPYEQQGGEGSPLLRMMMYESYMAPKSEGGRGITDPFEVAHRIQTESALGIPMNQARQFAQRGDWFSSLDYDPKTRTYQGRQTPDFFMDMFMGQGVFGEEFRKGVNAPWFKAPDGTPLQELRADRYKADQDAYKTGMFDKGGIKAGPDAPFRAAWDINTQIIGNMQMASEGLSKGAAQFQLGASMFLKGIVQVLQGDYKGAAHTAAIAADVMFSGGDKTWGGGVNMGGLIATGGILSSLSDIGEGKIPWKGLATTWAGLKIGKDKHFFEKQFEGVERFQESLDPNNAPPPKGGHVVPFLPVVPGGKNISQLSSERGERYAAMPGGGDVYINNVEIHVHDRGGGTA